jgi:hypothetical protein
MGVNMENVFYSLEENETDNTGVIDITYDDLIKEVDHMEMISAVNMDDIIALEIDYDTNYLKKDLERIAEYYEISKRKKRKNQLIEEIVLFEKNPENIEIVFRRKKLWSYIEEIKNDNYLSKFLILD